MVEDRRNAAIAIKSCLVDLERRANRMGLGDLAHFIALAALAADDAVAANAANEAMIRTLTSTTAGHC
jgi:hypothetical protein